MDTQLIGTVRTLYEKVLELEERIEKLEEENVETTNSLYELMNRQDILEDPKYEHLSQFTLGE